MKVLHICNAYQTNPLYQKLFNGLNDFGVRQDVLAPGEKDGSIVNNDVNVFYFKRKKSLLYRLLWPQKISNIVSYAESTFDIEQYQIIHAHTLFSDGAVAYWLYKKHKIKYVTAVRNTDLNEFFSLPIFKQLGYRILLNASAIYLISEANKRQFLEILPKGIKEQLSSKIYLLPNGIDEFWLSSINYKEAYTPLTLKLIYAGDICYNKNIHNVLAATLMDGEDEIDSFNAIGLKDTDKGKYIKDLIAAESKHTFFHLQRKCAKEDLRNKFRESDIYVQPSYKETFGLSYIEALTQGLPLIYSKGQGIDGMFKDGYVGYAVDPNSPQDILEKIRLIKKRYSEIMDNIHGLDFQKFSWDGIASDYYNNYLSIL